MHHNPTSRTSWLNRKRVLALGRVMCENLTMRKYFLEKFPNCFVNKGIKFFGDYSEEKEDIITTKIRSLAREGVTNDEIKSVLKQIEGEYIKKMKLPSSRLFCPKKYLLNDLGSIGEREILRIFGEILLTSTQMIESGFDIQKLIDLGILEKEIDIFYCKTDKKIKMNLCCDKCEAYPLYSFEKETLYKWNMCPEVFIEAMCSYALQKHFGVGGSVLCGHNWWDEGIKNWRELDFVDVGKKWAVLCSKGGLNVGNEKDQISLCKGFTEKIIFVSKSKKIAETSILFLGNILQEEHFEEILIGFFK